MNTPNNFTTRSNFRKAVDDFLTEHTTLEGLLKSKTQEVDLLTKVISNVEMLTEALAQLAPERLLPEYRLPAPLPEIKNEYERWLAKSRQS